MNSPLNSAPQRVMIAGLVGKEKSARCLMTLASHQTLESAAQATLGTPRWLLLRRAGSKWHNGSCGFSRLAFAGRFVVAGAYARPGREVGGIAKNAEIGDDFHQNHGGTDWIDTWQGLAGDAHYPFGGIRQGSAGVLSARLADRMPTLPLGIGQDIFRTSPK